MVDKDKTNVFVKYLPPDMDSEGLYELFSAHGKIISAKVMVDQVTNLSLGYGFVRFTTPKEAKRAISKLAGYKISSKTLLCRLSNNLATPEPSNNLYIKPLPPDLTEAGLTEEFIKFGQIYTVKIVQEKVMPYTRIGFVRYPHFMASYTTYFMTYITFENVECASKAIEEKNGARLAPDQPPLTVKYAESESKRALRKANALPKQIAKSARENALKANSNLNSTMNSTQPNATPNLTINANFPPPVTVPPIYPTPPPLAYGYEAVSSEDWGYAPTSFAPAPSYPTVPYSSNYSILLVPYRETHFPVYVPRMNWNGGNPYQYVQ